MAISPLKELCEVLKSSMNYKKSFRVVVLLILVLPFMFLLFYWCHTTNSLTLTSFAYLTLFNIGSLLTCLVSIWASRQQPTERFSFGFERLNVLTVFSSTILLILFGVNLIKHSVERVFEPPVVSTENMFLGLCVGVGIHLAVSCTVTNRPLIHAAEAATHNWLQRALQDLGHTVCSFSPVAGRLLLSKINPITLLIFGGAAAVVFTQILIDVDELYLADVTGCLFISALMCGTMLPLSVYSAKILLQTAPEHILPLLDKSLREASTLDGVLELKHEHFWTITFGSYAGSLHVRVRRDANEQEVLTQLTSRLASQLNDLTIQVVKEDWSIGSSPLGTTSTKSPTFSSSPPLSSAALLPPKSSSTALPYQSTGYVGGMDRRIGGSSRGSPQPQDHTHLHSQTNQAVYGSSHSHDQQHYGSTSTSSGTFKNLSQSQINKSSTPLLAQTIQI